MEANEKHAALFHQLVAMFHFAALQQMGKLKNPMTDKVERDLQQSQISIEMLEMLHVKTKGNLTAEEDRYLASMLRELRLNYVDEAGKGTTDIAKGEAAEPASPAAHT